MDLLSTCSILCNLPTWWCLANINMLLSGIWDREIKVPGDPSRVTLGQSESRDLSVPNVVIKV